jgi:hypothetical protein
MVAAAYNPDNLSKKAKKNEAALYTISAANDGG